MGSFNMGGRTTQPLARGGSGSNAIPSREMMGRPTSKRGTRRPEGMPGRSGHNPPEKGGPTIPLSEVVPLSHSENRWMPQAATGRGQGIKPDSPEMTQRKVKALLNKLTLDKFDSISSQILSWANRSTEETDGRTLRQVIALIFEKATDEAAFSTMYAKLCAKLQTELDPNVKDESLPAADGKPASGGQLFRKYLLNRCQEDFERGWAQKDATAAAAKNKEADDKAKKESNEQSEREAKEAEERGEKVAQQKEAELLSEEYYVAQKAKRRGLGLVRFVGELFKLSMISDRIMHSCIKTLLQNIVDPEEEEIESLCKLLSTVGKLLDQSEQGQNRMSVYIMRMRDMMKSASLNSRMRFMLQVSCIGASCVRTCSLTSYLTTGCDRTPRITVDAKRR
jgi:translation initiation factor 4G